MLQAKLRGLLAMAGRRRAEEIERTCELAPPHDAFRHRQLRALLDRPQRHVRLDFADEHPLIWPMAHQDKAKGCRRCQHGPPRHGWVDDGGAFILRTYLVTSLVAGSLRR